MTSTCRQPETQRREATFLPRFDIWEGDQEVVLYGDLPGVEPAGLDVHFEGGELSIVGRAAARHTGPMLLNEYGVGDFRRSFTVSETIDPHGIAAELRNGVLTVRLPKVAAARPRKIEVRVQ